MNAFEFVNIDSNTFIFNSFTLTNAQPSIFIECLKVDALDALDGLDALDAPGRTD